MVWRRVGRTSTLRVDQLIPPLSVVVAATGVWNGGVALRRLLPGRGRRVPLAVIVGAGQAGAVLSALRMIDAPPALYRV